MQIHLSLRNVRLTGAIHASKADGDLYAAINKVSDTLAGLHRERKTRLVDQQRESKLEEGRG